MYSISIYSDSPTMVFLSTKIDGFKILIGSNIGSMNLFQCACMELGQYLSYHLEFL